MWVRSGTTDFEQQSRIVCNPVVVLRREWIKIMAKLVLESSLLRKCFKKLRVDCCFDYHGRSSCNASGVHPPPVLQPGIPVRCGPPRTLLDRRPPRLGRRRRHQSLQGRPSPRWCPSSSCRCGRSCSSAACP